MEKAQQRSPDFGWLTKPYKNTGFLIYLLAASTEATLHFSERIGDCLRMMWGTVKGVEILCPARMRMVLGML